ncbi:MAG: hypothetical protein NZ898_02345 [Myxococcota bacterium]|nr:hypothetical protein [Myxococcota bacterium]MDW8361110.1 hypothetical protein [Myxococcales bacterium]
MSCAAWLLAVAIGAPVAAQSSDAGGTAGPGEEPDAPPRLPLLGPTSLSATSSSLLQWRGDDLDVHEHDDRVLVGVERLEMLAQGDRVSVSLRLDALLPLFVRDGASWRQPCPEGLEPTCRIRPDFRLERLSVQWRSEPWLVELGDGTLALGRGIALSLTRIDTLGVDTSHRGLRVGHDDGRLFGQLAGGLFAIPALRDARGPAGTLLLPVGGAVNPQNVDRLEDMAVVPDGRDVLLVAEGGGRLGAHRDIELAAHAVRAWFDEDPESAITADGWVLGWRMTAPSLFDGSIAVHLEADAMRLDHVQRRLGLHRRRWGRAALAQVVWSAGPTSVQVDVQDLRAFLLAPDGAPPRRTYGTAPVLDRTGEVMEDASNARGAALRVGHGFEPGPWSATAGLAGYGHSPDAREDPWTGSRARAVGHGWLEIERRAIGAETDWSLTVVAGVRRHVFLEQSPYPGVGSGDLEWSTVHGTVDFGLSSGIHALEIRLEHREERRRDVRGRLAPWRRGGLTISYANADTDLSVAPMLLWNTERDVPGLRLGPLTAGRNLYPGLEARWQLGDGRHTLRLFAGRTPATRLCSNGVCRDVPAFEGVELEAVLRI